MVRVAHHFFITICAASDSGGMEISMKKLKKVMALGLVALTLGGMAIPTLATTISENNLMNSPRTIEFDIPVDFNSSEPIVYIIDNFEITVTDTPNYSKSYTKGSASKDFTVRDLVSDANMGTVTVEADFYYNNKIADVTDTSSSVVKPAYSDLNVTGQSTKNNSTSTVTVSTNVVFYSSASNTTAKGILNLFVRANGTSYNLD